MASPATASDGGNRVTAGRMSWSEVRDDMTCADATCLWQDLDGLHVEPAPVHPPMTSILWAWTVTHSTVWRIRLDGATAYVATHQPAPAAGVPLVAWNSGDTEHDRVLQYRPAEGAPQKLAELQFTRYVAGPPGGDGTPVMFIARGVVSQDVSSEAFGA